MYNAAVFGSGRGSNFQAILQAVQAGHLPGVRIVLVLSNNSDAGILDVARANGIPALHISQKHYASEGAFASALGENLRKAAVDLVVLAGYMKRLPAQVVAEFRNRIINIHPALLPHFGGKGMYGLRVHEAVLAAHEPLTGVTVHIVDEDYDHGPIVLQRTVPVLASDTPQGLAARVLEMEHVILPEAIRLFAENRVSVLNGHSHVRLRPVQE